MSSPGPAIEFLSWKSGKKLNRSLRGRLQNFFWPKMLFLRVQNFPSKSRNFQDAKNHGDLCSDRNTKSAKQGHTITIEKLFPALPELASRYNSPPEDKDGYATDQP